MVKLLAENYHGILCAENYHDSLLPALNREEFPNLTYTRDLEDGHDFIRRTPEEYKAWFDGVTKECEILELKILEELGNQEKQFLYKLFQDGDGNPHSFCKIGAGA